MTAAPDVAVGLLVAAVGALIAFAGTRWPRPAGATLGLLAGAFAAATLSAGGLEAALHRADDLSGLVAAAPLAVAAGGVAGAALLGAWRPAAVAVAGAAIGAVPLLLGGLYASFLMVPAILVGALLALRIGGVVLVAGMALPGALALQMGLATVGFLEPVLGPAPAEADLDAMLLFIALVAASAVTQRRVTGNERVVHTKVNRNTHEWLVFGMVSLFVFMILGHFTRSAGAVEANYRVLVGILVVTLMYGLFAMGINLQFGFTGIINFGQVAFMAVGAYAIALFTLPPVVGGTWYADNPGWLYGWPIPAALLAGVGLAVLLALVVGVPTLRLREDYLAIVTIGIAEIVRILIMENEQWTRGTQPINMNPNVDVRPFADFALSNPWWASVAERVGVNPYPLFLFTLLVLTIVVVYVLYEALVRLPYGRVIRAIREDEDVARSLGKNTFVYKLQVLALGGVVGAVSGAFYYWNNASVTPIAFLPVLTFFGWIIVVVGGVGNNKGTILGALMLFGLFFEGTRYVPIYEQIGLSNTDQGAFRILVIGVLLMALMTFRPQGILGRKEELAFAR